MLDHARHYEQNMCDLYLAPAPPAPERLDAFQVFRKSNSTPYVYGTYYNHYDAFAEPDVDAAANVYHNLLNSRDYHRDEWKYKSVSEWTEDDTLSWVVDAAAATQGLGFCEYDVPFCNFRIPGIELRSLKREDIVHKMAHLNIDAAVSRRIGDVIYEKLQARLHEEMLRHSAMFRCAEGEAYAGPEAAQTVLDLDSLDHKNRLYALDYRAADAALLHPPCDSSDDDVFRTSDTASPEYSYGSDGSKSGDEEDKRKQFKRPPGRPKGSGRKVCKRPRSVSVPEFLRNLLLDPKYCPSIIKWEDHSLGKFRFVKPDEVAKLWGTMKQNDNMTFEKFSRAMRYHYRQSVLVSVPTARLVYQFGHKGPDFTTDNPNFIKVKSEFDVHDMSLH
ncbi:PREDICTED: ETS homologous factor-like [Papilio polytes]|uniref:ETS homologous factor-like n=1 Tax=Papilio polytes TaxID=76194 RepID=UPI000676A75B|nr:PREDICTED: ETS homologous factor-like [Papilio polytes]